MLITRRAALPGLVLAAAAVARPARAHGPTRQKLALSVAVKATPDQVWAVIGNFQDLSWVPAVAKVAGTGGNGVGAKRTVTLKSGGVWHDEELADYDAKEHTYGTFLPHIDVKVLPVADYSSHLMAAAGDGGLTTVTWRAAFYRGFPNNDPPPDLNEAAAIKAVTDLAQPALDGLKARFGGGA